VFALHGIKQRGISAFSNPPEKDSLFVMAGLVPTIHVFLDLQPDVDALAQGRA
jgi:hypothetical protein